MNPIHRIILLSLRMALILLTSGVTSLRAAELKIASVFTDHAVLQRDVAVPIWGWGDAGAEVTVEFAGQKKSVMADDRGKWLVKLDALKASMESRVLTVTAGNAKSPIVLKDILVGEVWLGSGQSNMAMMVEAAKEGDEAGKETEGRATTRRVVRSQS